MPSISDSRIAIYDFKSSLLGNGSNCKIALPTNNGFPLRNSGNIVTVKARIRLSAETGTTHCIYGEGNSGTTVQMFYIGVDVSKKIKVALRNNENTLLINSIMSTTRLNYGVWYDIFYQDNAGTVKLYIDNVEDPQSVAGAFNYVPAGTFTLNRATIGALIRSDSVLFFNAYMCEVAIWNRILTDAERLQVFAKGIFPSSGAVGVYKLNDISGDTAADSGTLGNNGTITAPTWSTTILPRPASRTSV